MGVTFCFIISKWEFFIVRIEKTVFISYHRTDVYTALAVYENLKNQGYDVFFDYRSISSGDFEQIITSNIRARAHFILILTPTALDRCNEPGDWLRREIVLAVWGGMSIWNNSPIAASAPTQTSQPSALQASQATKTQRPQPTITNTPSPSQSSIHPTAKFSITVEPTPILCVVNAFAGGGGTNIREAPNGKILATVLNGTVVTVIPNETQHTVNDGKIWIHVFVFINDVRVDGWMVNLCG